MNEERNRVANYTHYFDVDIGSLARERLEDYALSDSLTTAAGLELIIALVCDGVGSSEGGIRASREATLYVVASIRMSVEAQFPTLLINAIRLANRKIYDTIVDGITTIALAVIHVQTNTLYIASVGDSPIFLIRNNEMLRLNADHNVANETRWKTFSPTTVENPTALTRAIGADADVDVDVGIYLEPHTHPSQALLVGQQGLPLQEGDTVLVMSDGMTGAGARAEKVVSEKEFLRHALDSDIRLAGRSLLSYAKSRSPKDNLGLAMIFVDGKQRHFTPTTNHLFSGRQKWLLLAGLASLAIIICVLGFSLVVARQDQAKLMSTQARLVANLTLAATQTSQNDLAVLTATPSLTPSSTATASPTQSSTPTTVPTSTPTMTSTITPLPSPTPYEIGRVFVPNTDRSVAVFAGSLLQSSTLPLFARIDGGIFTADAAKVYFQSSAGLVIEQLQAESAPRAIQLSMTSTGSVFIYSGTYQVKTVFSEHVSFELAESCAGMRYLSNNSISLSCLHGGSCAYQLGDQADRTLPFRSTVYVDLARSTETVPVQAVSFDEAKHYFDLVHQTVAQSEIPPCLLASVDQDGDALLDDVDRCVESAGLSDLAGCPDSDGDRLADIEDACPAVYAETLTGCPNTPTPTPTLTPTFTPSPTSTPTLAPILPDRDRDGVPDTQDLCPNFAGAMSNGCRADGCCTG